MDSQDGYGPELARSNADLRADVNGLRHDLQRWQRDVEVTVQALQDEIEVRRILARFARRTWFWVMFWLAAGTTLLADIGRAYAHNHWWGLILWTSRHGDGSALEWALRAISFCWEVGLGVWLVRRAQVPRELVYRVAKGAPRKLDEAP